MKLFKRIFNGALIVIVVILLASKFFQLPNFFQVFNVLTGSMAPQINQGSLIVTTTPPLAEELMVGDVITFENQSEIVTHRIQEIQQMNGEYLFTTKGDANQKNDFSKVKIGQVKGRVILTVPKLGRILEILQRPQGKIALLLSILQFELLLECIGLSREIIAETRESLA